ncbi:MAG: phage/plasmid primase, P4 family [Gemmataceae bacterium]
MSGKLTPPTGHDTTRPTLLPHHLADLRRSGLSDAQIAACGFYSEGDAKAVARVLGWTGGTKTLGPGWVAPFLDRDGRPTGYCQFKPDRPRVGRNGKPRKYENPKGKSVRVYVPPGTRAALADPAADLLMTEGTKKGAKADQDGFPCLALVGVDGWSAPRRADASGKKIGRRQLMPDLAAVPWAGRRVYVVFDSDAAANPNVRRAERALAAALAAAGADVRVVRLPAGPAGAKVGLDDLLAAHGADALRSLLASAVPIDPPASPVAPHREADDDPHRLAGVVLAGYDGPAGRRLVYHDGQFAEWDAGVYRIAPADEFRARVGRAVRDQLERDAAANLAEWEAGGRKGKPPVAKKVTRTLVADTLQALAGMVLVPAAVRPPAWLAPGPGLPPPDELVAVPNGLIHLPAAAAGRADALLPPTPTFFNLHRLDFLFDPAAPPPTRWLAFLAQLWPDDPASVACLQEWFGYLLSTDTKLQKLLFLVGPRRAGKGTIARVLKGLVGEQNFGGPTLSGLTTEFGLAGLLGKTVALIADARLSRRADAGVVVERLLSITGEDTLDVNRKHLPIVSAKLGVRFVILSNELPRLGDTSGALAGRMILLRLTRTFFGAEDHNLSDRLLDELPGILLWAIDGWKRLQVRGRFLQPPTGVELLRDLEDLASPVGAFVRDCCVTGPNEKEEVGDLYRAWRGWCDEHGRKEPGTQQSFGRDLRAALPAVTVRRPRAGGERVREYVGVRLRTDADPPADDADPEAQSSGVVRDLVRDRSATEHVQNLGNSRVVRVVREEQGLLGEGQYGGQHYPIEAANAETADRADRPPPPPVFVNDDRPFTLRG